jgi:hypothetical protein
MSMSSSSAGAWVAGSTSEPACTGLLRVLELGLVQLEPEEWLEEPDDEEVACEANMIQGPGSRAAKKWREEESLSREVQGLRLLYIPIVVLSTRFARRLERNGSM